MKEANARGVFRNGTEGFECPFRAELGIKNMSAVDTVAKTRAEYIKGVSGYELTCVPVLAQGK